MSLAHQIVERVPFLARHYKKPELLVHDITLLSIMMALAGCGMIYEFLLSHYAARVLGATEAAIFGVFTVMIAAMGVGSFAAARIRNPFTGFAWLELLIAFIGSTVVLMIASVVAITYLMPSLIAQTYGLQGVEFQGGFIQVLQFFANAFPYIMAFFIGVLIGAEIPLIARVREKIYGQHLENNTGTIYGADYIGAGIGAFIFVVFLLQLEHSIAAVVAASVNLVAGIIFFVAYRKNIAWSKLLLFGHLLVAIIVLVVGIRGTHWESAMEDMLYKDKVIHSMQTRYQRVVVTKRIMDPTKAPVYALHINGHTQFSSRDEHIYHSMLVYPAMAASARQNQVLIIGGGDGLALRDVLKWNPKQVTLVDLDERIIDFFSEPYYKNNEVINTPLIALNENAFNDPRVDVKVGDAFLIVDELLQSQSRFDTIIVDLPDPNHPDLNKLYTARFYSKLQHILAGDGAISVQSTSPYHAPEAFKSIGKTMAYAGFKNVEQYHANVPSFGEWGWTIATPQGQSAKQRLQALDELPLKDNWLTQDLLLSAFAFGKPFYDDINHIKINRLNSTVLFDYHRQGWARESANIWQQ